MNDQDLRDCFAMFAMTGLMMSGVDWKAEYAYQIADEMLEARKAKTEEGIVAIKKRKPK